jgi:hypothetical protein
MREEIEKNLKVYRKTVDEKFEPLENFAKGRIERSVELSKMADDTHNMLKVRLADAVSKSDLELLSKIVALQSMIQSDLARIAYNNTTDLKEVAYELVRVPLEIIIKTLSIVVKLVPKLDLETREMMDEKLRTIEKEVQTLKKSKSKITLKISSAYDEALKELTRRIEETKRAQKGYKV